MICYIWEVGQNLNFFKNTWFLHHLKDLLEDFSMGLLLKFSLVVLQMFEFSFSEKRGFFIQDLERTSYLEWHQKEDFWWAFCNFLGMITHNFVKSDPKFEHKDLLHAQFHGAWHKRIFRSQSCDIWGLGLKN